MAAAVDYVQKTIHENLGGAAPSLAKSEHQFSPEQVPDQTGKVAVITGGSEGIGWGERESYKFDRMLTVKVTSTLLDKNIKHVHVLSVSQEVVDKALDDVRQTQGEDVAKRVTWHQCDMGDWPRVAKVAGEIAHSTDRIDILVNNAARGIMTYQLTDYGVDRHMAVNHMGHDVLTSHLLPLLIKTADQGHTVRIVNQASNLHEGAPKDTQFASLDELNRDLGPNALYGRAKLANILYARYLARHLTKAHPRILANATHPGIVSTAMSKRDIHEPYPLTGYAMSTLAEPLKKDALQGATSALYAATVTDNSGEYICPPATREPGSALSQDVELAEQLMRLTRDVVRQKTAPQSADRGCPFRDY